MNNEIVQSILSTYTALRTYLQALNSRTVMWVFTILHENLNVWLYYVTFVCCLMALSRRLEPRWRSFPVLACAIPRQTGASVTIVHACITALHGLQINCAILKWRPSARHIQTWPWAHALFSPPKNCWRSSSAWYDVTRYASCEQRRLLCRSRQHFVRSFGEVLIACRLNSRRTTRTVDGDYKDLFVFKLT